MQDRYASARCMSSSALINWPHTVGMAPPPLGTQSLGPQEAPLLLARCPDGQLQDNSTL